MSKNEESLTAANRGVVMVERTAVPKRGTFTLTVPDGRRSPSVVAMPVAPSVALASLPVSLVGRVAPVGA